MLPVPTVAALASFTGRPLDSFTAFAGQALTQATLLFSLRTRLTVMPTDPDTAQLATYAILQMADRIYLEQPNAVTLSSPYQSETIGSYSYSKGSTASKATDGVPTGLYWWDLAMDLLTEASESLAQFGSIHMFNPEIYTDADGNAYIVSPADFTAGSGSYEVTG